MSEPTRGATIEDVRVTRWQAEPRQLVSDLDGLAALLHACVHAGASIGFVLPFSLDDARGYWRDKIVPVVATATCEMLVAWRGEAIVGTVQLDLGTMPNQAHRAEVRKLLVHPEARRRGIARALMVAIEAVARAARRDLLTLDTRTGDSAEPLYTQLGYTTVGTIPRYARRWNSDELDATTVMYKQLASA
jgi:ribosomal protein S18 acetylase RimI-like enzyme